MDDLTTTESFVYFVENYVNSLNSEGEAVFPHAVVLVWLEGAQNIDFPLTTPHLGRFCRALSILAASNVDMVVKDAAADLLLQYLIPDLYYIPFLVWQERHDAYFTQFLLEHMPEPRVSRRPHILFALANNCIDWLVDYINFNSRDFTDILADAPDNVVQQTWLFYTYLPLTTQQTFLDSLSETFYTYNNPLLLFDFVPDNYRFPTTHPRLNVARALAKNEPVELTEEYVAILIELVEQNVRNLHDLAADVLRNLAYQPAREFVCLWLITHENQLITQIAVEKGYAPSGPAERAIFYFITRQFSKYDELDFDHRLMEAYYNKTTMEIRRRITAIVRETGRADYTDIIIIREQKLTAGTTDEEILAMIQVLQSVKDWRTLWQLVFELPFNHSLRILLLLSRVNWQPDDTHEQEVLQELSVLAHRIVPYTSEYLNHLNLPIMSNRIKISDKIFSVNFETNDLGVSSNFAIFSMLNIPESTLPTLPFSSSRVRLERIRRNQILFSIFQEGADVRSVTLKLPGEELKYFDVSPNGWSLVTTDEAYCYLWDLTLIRLSDLFSLASSIEFTKLEQVERIRDFINLNPDLPMRVYNILNCYHKILMYRFQHAVELDFNFSIVAEPDDIELEAEENS